MVRYLFVLRNDKLPQYDRFAVFILLLNLLVFLYVFIVIPEDPGRIIFLAGALLLLTAVIFSFYLLKHKNEKVVPVLKTGLVLSTIIWAMSKIYIAAAICLVLLTLYHMSRRQIALRVEDERLVYSSYPEKVISWNDLSNVILKDGLLTVDLKNNHIIQSEILRSTGDINEKEFNDFCSQRLASTG